MEHHQVSKGKIQKQLVIVLRENNKLGKVEAPTFARSKRDLRDKNGTDDIIVQFTRAKLAIFVFFFTVAF